MPPHIYNDVDPIDDESHQIISSYFLGPKAENYDFFKKCVIEILDAQKEARLAYQPNDGDFITKAVQGSKPFLQSSEKMYNALKKASELLGKHSIPFWSPRYQGHMCMDLSMPALLGYFMTMIYNPNNVSIEASPLTTVAEIQVGLDLCKLFGYNIDKENKSLPLAWGHIACDGTVANLESMWAARNLKYYPLSLKNAMRGKGPLNFIAKAFEIEKCEGGMEKFDKLTTWELQNLRPSTILEIPERLYKEYHISTKFLDGVMKKYGVQSLGKSAIEKEFGGIVDMKYLLSSTRHYSWPKSAAITGIGDANVIGINVDHEARVDLEDLKEKLQKCYDDKVGVYAIVAIIGSTEEGAVDPLTGILELRAQFQEKGLSFLVHGDAAWGGYFCSIIPEVPPLNDVTPVAYLGGQAQGFVPESGLREQTMKDLIALRMADSITVDPHKAAYVPYPAGGLCYRDERMRFLLTFTSPYISRGETSATSIGVFGVEGSKPGASVMSTWFSNACIGLNPDGYGTLLGEVTFTCSRLSAEWAAMSTDKDDFVVKPLNLLPSERLENSTPEIVEAERQRIRDQILQKTNMEIVDNDESRDPAEKATTLLRKLGSDLNINAFSTNWRYDDAERTLNTEVEEANYFNYLVIQELSVDSPEDDPTNIDFYLTSTTFLIDEYGECAQNFKERLGLQRDGVDLVVMRNVVMSPWPTDGNFISKLIEVFRGVLRDKVVIMRQRNDVSPTKHSFLLQGTDKTYMVHFPMFHLEKHRHQLIIEVELPEEAKKIYLEKKKAYPSAVFVLNTEDIVKISTMVMEKKPFKASLAVRIPKHTQKPSLKDPEVDPNFPLSQESTIISNISVSITEVIKDKSLKGRFRDRAYPSDIVPFYLYGNKTSLSIDHVLVKSPNIQLSADGITLDFEIPASELKKGAILTVEGLSEAAMQPFESTEGSLRDSIDAESDFFFTPGRTLPVSVYADDSAFNTPGPGLLDGVLKLNGKEAKLLGEGTMTLGAGRFVDSEAINFDPFAKKKGSVKYNAWKKIFDDIGKELK